MAIASKNNFLGGLNLDFDPLRLPPNVAIFLKNITANININQGAAGASGQNANIFTPLEGNQAMTVTLPAGNNYCTGWYSSEQTNEGYFFLYNSSNNHSIWVISGENGDVRKVHESNLLPFVLDPQYFLAEGRITLTQKSVIDPVTLAESNFKFLIFTNNYGNQCFIDVEASIETDSYTTSYFTDSEDFYNPLELIHLGAATPLKCIGLDDYTPVESDAGKQNLLINASWQFRIKTWDIWGRPSNWGIISSVYSVIIGGGCITTSNGLPRCVKLVFDAGNPLVKFITVAYRRGVGNDPSGEIETLWNEYDTFSKYDDSTGVPWYERPISPVFADPDSGISFDDTTNSITYTFCADKGSIPIDPNETALTEPGLARYSSTSFSIEESIGLGNNVYGFQPIAQETVDAINFSVVPPETSTCAAAPLRTITFYSAIYKPVATLAGAHRGFMRTAFGKVVFGDAVADCGGAYSAFTMDEVFADQENPGFISVLRGTDFKCICRQGTLDPSTGAFIPIGFGSTVTSGTNMVQEFTFTGVPAGRYIAQIASHKSKISDSNLQQTSTYVGGICTVSDLVAVTGLNAFAENPIKEIEIDCSAGNVLLNGSADPIFVILDMIINSGSAAIDGYLYGQNGEEEPIEMTPMYFSGAISGSAIDTFGSFFTDHNGFYFGVTTGTSINAYAYADLCDGLGPRNLPLYGPSNTSYPYLTQGAGGIKHGDGTGTSGGCAGVHGNWANRVFLFPTSGEYPDEARRRFYQEITLCSDPTTGVPGIPLIMTKVGPFQFTNGDGAATLIAHNRYDYLAATTPRPAPWLSEFIPDYSAVPYNQDKLIFSQKGGCQWSACDTCDTFMADITLEYLDCGDAPDGCAVTGIIEITRIDDGGSGYANDDEFSINTGTTLALAKVIANTGGVVTAILITSPGAGYVMGVTCATTNITGTGIGLLIGILSTLPRPRTTCLDDVQVQPTGIGIFGLQSGAKYGVGWWAHDVIGRHCAPQIKQGELGYVYTPNLNDTSIYPYPTMGLCGLQVTVPSGLTIDPIFTRITFLVSPNSLFYDFFSWSADWVQYVDNTGATNPTNPTAIRIYFQSLNEYNKQYNFKTNVAWDFIAQSIGQTAPSDVVQFIMNGDGTWLPPVKGAEVTYDQYGSFFTIAYQPELANLQNGCLFRIIRPKQNISPTVVPYYEQCLTLDVVGGVIPEGVYDIPYVDSYLLARSIPVPALKGQPSAIPPGGNPPNTIQLTSSNQNSGLDVAGYSTNNKANSNKILIFGLSDFQTDFPFFFESPSRSDLWGSHSGSPGRVGIPNVFEQQTRIGTEIAISNPLSNAGFVNGLGTFLNGNKQIFSRNSWGDITSILVETSIVLVICDRDHFLLRYGGSNVFVDPNTGNVLSRNAQGIFQAPERKAGTNYGCEPSNINTIRRYSGAVRWLDSAGYLVLHNFSVADSNTDQSGYLAYLLQKIAMVNIQRLDGRTPLPVIYWIGGIDMKTSEYYLTVFRVPGAGSPSYINTQTQPVTTLNETLVFDLKSLVLKGFASFTPEYYGLMPSFYSQRQFFSFKQGVPYTHHNNFQNPLVSAPPVYCSFYGTRTEVRITLVVNGVKDQVLPDKVKRFLYMEVYVNAAVAASPPNSAFSTVLLYADSIKTDKGQLSRLLAPRWIWRNNLQAAAILCDLNTPSDSNLIPQTTTHAILDGNQMQGRWMQISLTNSSDWTGSYFELSEAIVYLIGLEKSGD